MDKALAKERLRDQKCPYCGAHTKDLAYGNVENDGNRVLPALPVKNNLPRCILFVK